MTAQAMIFDLSTFNDPRADTDAKRLLHEAIDDGCHCALVSDLPHAEAGPYLRQRFGDVVHHLFSVVLTDADFAARGHKSPYSTVLTLLGVDANDALVVASSQPAVNAARLANIRTRQAGALPC